MAIKNFLIHRVAAYKSELMLQCVKNGTLELAEKKQKTDTNIHIGSVNNSVVGGNNEHISQTNIHSESKKSSFWRGVWEKIVANSLWALIIFFAGIIASYFGFKFLK